MLPQLADRRPIQRLQVPRGHACRPARSPGCRADRDVHRLRLSETCFTGDQCAGLVLGSRHYIYISEGGGLLACIQMQSNRPKDPSMQKSCWFVERTCCSETQQRFAKQSRHLASQTQVAESGRRMLRRQPTRIELKPEDKEEVQSRFAAPSEVCPPGGSCLGADSLCCAVLRHPEGAAGPERGSAGRRHHQRPSLQPTGVLV